MVINVTLTHKKGLFPLLQWSPDQKHYQINTESVV